MERFNLNNVNDVEIKEEHQIEISNTTAAMEDLDGGGGGGGGGGDVDINRAWERI